MMMSYANISDEMLPLNSAGVEACGPSPPVFGRHFDIKSINGK
jgi:hypothetical protein